MAVQTVTTKPNNRYSGTLLAGTTGAVAGAGARYVIPQKGDFSSVFNKEAVDKFVSSASTKARGESRSILKYAGIGAIAAIALNFLSKVFPKPKEEPSHEYTKWNALIDAPDYACEIMWYGE